MAPAPHDQPNDQNASDRATWDESLLACGGHLLQSSRWGILKERHGWRVERVHLDDARGFAHAQILFKHRGPISVGYIPRGPVVRGDAAIGHALFDAIDDVCRQHRSLTLIVEPNEQLPFLGRYREAGFVRGPAHIQPSRTVKVPLLDDDALVAQMHAKTRYNLRLAERRGVTVERQRTDGAAIDTFLSLLDDTAGRNQFGVHSAAYYRDFGDLFASDAVLLIASLDGVPVAGAIAACFGKEGVYMYGGSSTRHRAHAAGFLVQFEAMRWARERGCDRYDLWGIPAEDPSSVGNDEGDRVAASRGDDRRGLYEFKVRFGGRIVTYPPTLERRYRPVLAFLARRALGDRWSGGG